MPVGFWLWLCSLLIRLSWNMPDFKPIFDSMIPPHSDTLFFIPLILLGSENANWY